MSERLILASVSPQRKSLLAGLGWSFRVVPSEVDEEACMEKDPARRARALARLKAEAVAVRYQTATVIGCDTLVVTQNGTLLEKPIDADDARRMLRLLSGKECLVHSGLCIMKDGQAHDGLSTSSVFFADIDDRILDWWMKTGLWHGRSGSFQIDGPGQLLIEHIEGEQTSVVGLPIFLLRELLLKAGVDFTEL